MVLGTGSLHVVLHNADVDHCGNLLRPFCSDVSNGLDNFPEETTNVRVRMNLVMDEKRKDDGSKERGDGTSNTNDEARQPRMALSLKPASFEQLVN